MSVDHLSMDEITVQHDDAMKIIISKSRDKIFDNLKEASLYTVDCIKKAVSLLDVDIKNGMSQGIIDDKMKEAKVHIERYNSNGFAGMFFYKDDQVEYYVSEMEKKTGDIIFHKPKWVVRTNVTI